MLNASNRKSIREAEKRARQRDRNVGEFLHHIMATPIGREWIWDKLSTAHIFSAIAPTDALQMAFLEGERNQGLVLLNDIMHHCPDQFIQAMREANERRSLELGTTDGEYSGGEDAGRNTEGPEPAAYVHPDHDARPANVAADYNPTEDSGNEGA